MRIRRRRLSTTVRVAMSVAVAGGIMLATALPASAEGGDRAWAVQDYNGNYAARGLIAVATDYHSPVVSAGITLPGLLATGAVMDKATPYLSSSQVGSVVVQVSSRVTVRAVGLSSWCRVGTSSVYGGAALGSGSVLQVGGTTIPLPVNPAAGTVIDFPGGHLVLNDQIGDPSEITIYGMDIFPGNGEEIRVAATYCDSFV